MVEDKGVHLRCVICGVRRESHRKNINKFLRKHKKHMLKVEVDEDADSM